MDVRDMKGDPGIWEKLSWADMSSKEQEYWSTLGWRQDKWDKNEAPASTNKLWKDLTFREQSAAINLGFTENLWNNFEDQ